MSNENDDVTENLLAELDEQAKTREQLEARATELGVKFRGNTGDDTLRERIAEAEAALEPTEETDTDPVDYRSQLQSQRVITNTGRNPTRIASQIVPVGGKYTLTDMDLSNENMMAKIARGIELGLLTRGAD